MKRSLSLVVALILFAGGALTAQEKTGIGFEYGGGYLMPTNDFEMRSVQSFALTMNMTSELSVGIFREEGSIRGENSYTGEDDNAGDEDDIDLTLINTGDISITGLRFKHTLPVDTPVNLRAGMEIGTARFSNDAYDFRATGGSGTPASGSIDGTNWGLVAAPAGITGSHPALGLLIDSVLVSKETDTLDVSIGAGIAYRIISLPDIYALGEREAEFVDADDESEIDPISNFNNLAVTVGLNIGF